MVSIIFKWWICLLYENAYHIVNISLFEVEIDIIHIYIIISLICTVFKLFAYIRPVRQQNVVRSYEIFLIQSLEMRIILVLRTQEFAWMGHVRSKHVITLVTCSDTARRPNLADVRTFSTGRANRKTGSEILLPQDHVSNSFAVNTCWRSGFNFALLAIRDCWQCFLITWIGIE